MENKLNKQKKIKIPGLFRKQFNEKDFNAKILKWIQIGKDKDYIQSLYNKDSSGIYILKEDVSGFSKEDEKRLKLISGAVINNRKGFINIFKITLLIIIVVCIIVFNILFKNMIVSKAIESGLEAVFNAKAEITGLNFELFKARIFIGRLTVANRDNPMKNLFELGNTEIYLNSPELFKGKIVINNIECLNILWNTDRKTSGILTKKKTENKEIPSNKETGRQNSIKMPDIGKIDVDKLVGDNKTNLQSFDKISNTAAEIAAVTNKWNQNLGDFRKKLDDLTKTADEIKKIDSKSFKNIADAQGTIAKIGGANTSLNSLRLDAEKMSGNIDSDKQLIDKKFKAVREIIDNDYKYLVSLVQLPGGGVKGIVSSIAETYIKSKFGKLYFYALKAKEYAGVLINKDKPGKEKLPESKRRQGFNVSFPTTVYPGFLIRNIAASAGKKDSPDYTEAYFRDISSDADLWNKPAVFHILRDQNNTEIRINGYSDSRSNALKTFGIEFQAKNLPLEINEGLPVLNAKSFRGVYQFDTGFDLDKDNSTKGSAVLKISGIKIELNDNKDFISKIVSESITSTPYITMEIDYSITPDGIFSIGIKNNIDSVISQKMGKTLNDMSKKYESELKIALMKLVEPGLKKNEALYGAFKDLDNISKGDIKNIDSLKAELEKKKKEIESQANKQIEDIKKKLPEGTENKVNDAVKKLPKLPGF